MIQRIKSKICWIRESFLSKIKDYPLIIGLVSLLWLLFRSGSKPSRINYPCQKTCSINVSVFLVPTFLLYCRRIIRRRKLIDIKVFVKPFISAVCIFLIILSSQYTINYFQGKRSLKRFEELKKLGPIGKVIGMVPATGMKMYKTSKYALSDLPSPSRVVSVHNSLATNWDHVTEYHWEYIDQDVVSGMVERGVMVLTGETNIVDAWNTLIPYQAGEDVAIKINFNNSYSCGGGDDEGIDAYSETVNAVIEGLISIGVTPDHIWITDPSRVIPDRFTERIINSDVQYYSINYSCDHPNYHDVVYVDTNSIHVSYVLCPEGEKVRPAQVFVDAEHLINIPIFKSHGNYVTLALKNHYGSALIGDYPRGSSYLHQCFETGSYCNRDSANLLADINNNPHIRDKTRLIIGEGLFGNPRTNWQETETWAIFGNDDPNILFFSADPVAISSVMTDYIIEERIISDIWPNTQDHYQLHAAALLGLGVHDHWDNFENKNYTAFDYIEIDEDSAAGIIETKEIFSDNFKLYQNYPNPFNATTTIEYSIEEANFVRLAVYDVSGREVKKLVEENKPAGKHTVVFEATDLTPGVYFYKIEVGNLSSQPQKMILVE